MNDANLTARKCKACEGGTPPLNAEQIADMLRQVSGWEYVNGEIVKTFAFKNYYLTVSFVNAAAWIAHQEDHHPNMEFGYKTCRIRYSTHSINGLSENDFICAAKINALIAGS